MTKQELKKFVEEEKIDFPLNDLETISGLFNDLESENLIKFSLGLRSDSSGSEWWLQNEYWSPKLNKTVIYDYNATHNYETLDELFDYIDYTAKKIDEFEAKITFNK